MTSRRLRRNQPPRRGGAHVTHACEAKLASDGGGNGGIDITFPPLREWLGPKFALETRARLFTNNDTPTVTRTMQLQYVPPNDHSLAQICSHSRVLERLNGHSEVSNGEGMRASEHGKWAHAQAHVAFGRIEWNGAIHY